MIEVKNQANRKVLKEDRVAICPKFGCNTLERVKPLKLGIFGTKKYPICRIHKTPLVFIEEFIGDFLQSVNACLLDISLVPPNDLQKLLKQESPENFISFFNNWMYCSSIGRGAKIVPEYLDSLSRAYKNSLTKKQIKSIDSESDKKKREKLIILGYRKIEMEYIEFLKKLYDMDEKLYKKELIQKIPPKVKELIQSWLNELLKNINMKNNNANSLILKKKEYDKILQARTCMLLLGRSPLNIPIKISAFELFSAYRIFLDNGLCHEFVPGKVNIKKEEDSQISNPNILKVKNNNKSIRNYGVIYLLIDNNIDNFHKYKMFYIGQTIQSLKKRFYSHINYSSNKYLREAFSRYKKNLSLIKIDNQTLQTRGREFTFKAIKRCKDIEELNASEKFFIKKYKTCVLDHYFFGLNGKRRPLYGYNITRGGGGYPAITGEEHHSFIEIDQSSLKDLIKRGFSAEEIAIELEISIPTLISKVEYYWNYLGIENLRDARKYFGGNEIFLKRFGNAAKSVVGIELNIPELIDYIEQGLFLSELEEQLKTSFSTITNHLQKIGYQNLTDARIKLGAMEIFRKRWQKKKESNTLKGSDHQDYIPIDKEEIKKFIKLGKSADEIANYLSLSRPTVLSRVKEFWGIKFYEAKRLFNIYPKLDKKLGNLDISNIGNCGIIERDVMYLQSLIFAGFNMTQIAYFYEKGVKSMRKFMTKTLNIDFTHSMYFQSAKDEFYWKPRIINAIMADNNLSDTINKLHSTSHFRELGRIWKKEYDVFNRSNYELYNYLKRIYLLYPILDNKLLISLLNKKKQPYEIDEQYIRKLLRNTSSMQEFAVKLQMGLGQARNFLRSVMKINYNEAVREYVWKPELTSYIKKYDSILDIANNEDYNLSTLRNRFKMIWSDEIEQLGSLKKAYHHLKEKFNDH